MPGLAASNQALRWSAAGLPIVRSICVVGMTRATLSTAYLAWHLIPYLLIIILIIKSERFVAVCAGVSTLMCAADAWLFTETMLGIHSRFRMAVGILATLKVFSLLPAGAAIGASLGGFVRP